MSRIGPTLSGIERQLLTSLAASNAQIAMSALRMTTGHKINAASDNPSAFIQLSGLQSQMSNVSNTLGNVTAADGMVSQIKTAVASIQTQLGIIQDELKKDVNHTLTPDQRAEAQNKIDQAIAQISLLAESKISGTTPLSGAADFFYAGRDSSQVAKIQVHNILTQNQTISGTVASAATQAEIAYTGDASNLVTADATFTLAGQRGDTVISVTTGDTLASVATKVNDSSYATGITAAVDTGTHELIFTSVDYGSQAKTEITVSSGTFATVGNTTGTNASAVINGETISANSTQVVGNSFSLNQNGLSYNIEFQPGFTGSFAQITVTGSALTFALSTDMYRTSTLAVPGVYPEELGGVSGTLDQLATGGSLSGLGNNTAQALRVLEESLGDMTVVSGNVSGFYNSAIQSSSGLLTGLQTELQKSIDSIDETNDDVEIANIDYYQALASNATSGLMILNQQRQGIVDLVRQIAGLSTFNLY
jgi:flagellin-like hook-associated protein FlgL